MSCPNSTSDKEREHQQTTPNKQNKVSTDLKRHENGRLNIGGSYRIRQRAKAHKHENGHFQSFKIQESISLRP